MRHHGKTASPLQDYTGRIQLYARADQLGDDFVHFTDVDLGDFVGVTGDMLRDADGRADDRRQELHLPRKSLRPLPEKWHGLKTWRRAIGAAGTSTSSSTRRAARSSCLRSRLIKAIREFLDARGFLESRRR